MAEAKVRIVLSLKHASGDIRTFEVHISEQNWKPSKANKLELSNCLLKLDVITVEYTKIFQVDKSVPHPIKI